MGRVPSTGALSLLLTRPSSFSVRHASFIAFRMASTREKGAVAERVAEGFFLRQGYALVERNFQLHRRGEIDLILRRGEELLFVEVKGRKEFHADEAWQPLWRKKKRRLRLVAQAYLARHGERLQHFTEWRLEIVYVTQGRVNARFEEPFF